MLSISHVLLLCYPIFQWLFYVSVRYSLFSISFYTGKRTFSLNDELFMFNNVTAYSVKLMKYIDNMISIGAISFEKVAEIMENNWNSHKIYAARIEEAWFIYRITEFVLVFQSWPRHNKSQALDLEMLCHQNYTEINQAINETWMKHMCTEVGVVKDLLL